MTPIYQFAGSAVSLIATMWCFKANQAYRCAIDGALGSTLKIPERVYPLYGAAYLNEFVSMTARQPTALGKCALDLYIRPTLLWIDVSFAFFCASFSSLFWWRFLILLPSYHFVDIVTQFLLVMSVVYGIADIAEDLWLAKLFLK